MDWATSEAVSVLSFLLPGFVAAAVFYALTSHPRPSEFERIVQALIFTALAQVGTAAARGICLAMGRAIQLGLWDAKVDLAVAVVLAIGIGVAAVKAANGDALHARLRKLGLTRENSFPSEWYSAFSRNAGSYVVLHLPGARRLFGWPAEWPGRPGQGHFSIEEPEWLEGTTRLPAEGVSSILVSAAEVEMVEFVPAIHSGGSN